MERASRKCGQCIGLFACAQSRDGRRGRRGSTNAALSPTAITNGASDSFAASYDTNGNQLWEQQIPVLNSNQANAVTVDAQGNVYIGGSAHGLDRVGQTSAGGTDAYVAQLSGSGQIVAQQQFGTSGNDKVSAMAMTSDGGVVVASNQNGQAVLSKYAGGTITGTPEWTMNLGSLNNGSNLGHRRFGQSDLCLGNDEQHGVDCGRTGDCGGPQRRQHGCVCPRWTDNGTSATANTVSYVSAPGGSTTGGNVTVGPDGTVYLAGTTTGTFAGQSRSVKNVNHAFVTALAPAGTIDWTRQFGGADGQSTGAAVAVSPTGSSVLNALGLPSGTVNVNQTVNLSSNTTLRTGDSAQSN